MNMVIISKSGCAVHSLILCYHNLEPYNNIYKISKYIRVVINIVIKTMNKNDLDAG